MELILALLLIFSHSIPNVESRQDDGGKSLIGTQPTEFKQITWLTEVPIRLSDLRGKVVLIRWWTAPECPFCAASAPALNRFRQEFPESTFVVIGLYHHKSARPMTKKFVREQISQLGFQFPVGIDNGWGNLKRWWLQTGDRAWTSVTFLLDREGVIRYIHPGGTYSEEPTETFPSAQEDYKSLRSQLLNLLKNTNSTR